MKRFLYLFFSATKKDIWLETALILEVEVADRHRVIGPVLLLHLMIGEAQRHQAVPGPLVLMQPLEEAEEQHQVLANQTMTIGELPLTRGLLLRVKVVEIDPVQVEAMRLHQEIRGTPKPLPPRQHQAEMQMTDGVHLLPRLEPLRDLGIFIEFDIYFS